MERDELGRFPKLNYEEIKNNIEQYNYYLLSLDVKNSKQKLIIKDKLDYLYYVSYFSNHSKPKRINLSLCDMNTFVNVFNNYLTTPFYLKLNAFPKASRS